MEELLEIDRPKSILMGPVVGSNSMSSAASYHCLLQL
jgi:hypothetical protein